MKQSIFPRHGWDEEPATKALFHYEDQIEEEAIAEYEVAFEEKNVAVIGVSKRLVPAVQDMAAKVRGREGNGA